MNIKALSPPPFYLLSASTLVSCNNVLIGFSYFHSGEYKWGKKGLSHSGLVWLPAVLFLNALSWPCEIFFFLFHAISQSLYTHTSPLKYIFKKRKWQSCLRFFSFSLKFPAGHFTLSLSRQHLRSVCFERATRCCETIFFFYMVA